MVGCLGFRKDLINYITPLPLLERGGIGWVELLL